MDADDYGYADMIGVAVRQRCVGIDSGKMVDSLSICGSIASLFTRSTPQS